MRSRRTSKACTMYVTRLIWRHIAESQSIWRDVAQRFQITCAYCAHKRVDIVPVFRSRIKRFLKSVRHTQTEERITMTYIEVVMGEAARGCGFRYLAY